MAAPSADAPARPLDLVVGGYFVLSALAYVSPHRTELWPLLVGVHLVFGGALLTGRWDALRRWARNGSPGEDRSPGPLRRAVAFVTDWYALLLLPFLYWELPFLNQSLWGGRYFDGIVQGWEEAVFGSQTAITFQERVPSLWVSEPLHFSYLSYYFILYLYPAVVYFRRGRDAFLDTLFGMMLSFAVHYAVFITFPVKGPYFLFPPPGEPQSAGPMYQTVQYILGNGASSGTAFPSSHAAVSATQVTNAIRHYPAAVPLLVVGTVGIALGAVYSGIHYGIDTTVGVVTGLLVGFLVPVVRRWLK